MVYMRSQGLTDNLAKLQQFSHNRLKFTPNNATNRVYSKVTELICTHFLSSMFLSFFPLSFSHSSTLSSVSCTVKSVTLGSFDKNGVEITGGQRYLEVFDKKSEQRLFSWIHSEYFLSFLTQITCWFRVSQTQKAVVINEQRLIIWSQIGLKSPV